MSSQAPRKMKQNQLVPTEPELQLQQLVYHLSSGGTRTDDRAITAVDSLSDKTQWNFNSANCAGFLQTEER